MTTADTLVTGRKINYGFGLVPREFNGHKTVAHTGGIPGLANLTTAQDILREAYGESAPQEEFRVNGHTLKLPGLFDTVLPLDAAIPVDYYVPGCPPSRNIVAEALRALLGDSPPPPGNFHPPLAINRRDPLWERGGVSGFVEGLANDPPEVLVTSLLDGSPHHRYAFPTATIWPLLVRSIST